MKLYSSLLLAPRLDEVTLRALVYGETCVLRIPDFCPLPVRERLLSFTRQSRLEPYQAIAISEGRQTVKNLGVHRVGTPFNLTYSSGSLDDYYAKVSTMTQALRDACAPDIDPIEQLIFDLNRHWPGGAMLASFHGEAMHAGIIRVVLAAESAIGAAQPHFDCLPPAVCPLVQQFAACIYLDTPEQGGELEVWNVPPRTALEISEIDAAADLRGMLPPSTLTPVYNGDLILFNARRPHCVRPFAEGERTSLHAFAGLLEGGGLVLWS